MSERSYRIRTDVNNDKVVRFKTEQDYDFLEILSLKIKQEDTYKLHTANYGVIVGRVLANDSFGIPNAKVSVFIELDDEDKLNSEITNIYPYTSFQTVDSKGRRYNLLPDESTDECYQVVGTFPNKRLVLDNDTYLEVFDKYWKYTTVTNKSGDYMIFGVPTGGHWSQPRDGLDRGWLVHAMHVLDFAIATGRGRGTPLSETGLTHTFLIF